MAKKGGKMYGPGNERPVTKGKAVGAKTAGKAKTPYRVGPVAKKSGKMK